MAFIFWSLFILVFAKIYQYAICKILQDVWADEYAFGSCLFLLATGRELEWKRLQLRGDVVWVV